jgi:predicted RNA binding protein YcfA (HicA-like mRNA interferase family)
VLAIEFFLLYYNSMNARDILKMLKANGWEILRQERRSHIRLGKSGSHLTVPAHGIGMSNPAHWPPSSGKPAWKWKNEGKHGNALSS